MSADDLSTKIFEHEHLYRSRDHLNCIISYYLTNLFYRDFLQNVNPELPAY